MTLEPLMRYMSTDVPLNRSPINPDWVESGTPEANSAVLGTSDDRLVTAVLWTCTPGRFTWHYGVDESIYFLEGRVTISMPGQPARKFGAGDFVHFSKGAVATWVIDSTIRKVA